jgi:hypothetical protein
MDHRRIVNRRVVGAAASAGIASLVFSGAVHAGEYAYDDGSSEQVISRGGGEVAAIHAFSIDPGQESITTISMAFGSPTNPGVSGLAGGEPLSVYLWSDDEGDGDPSNGGFTLLNTTVTTISAASIDTDVFQSVAITPTVVPHSGFFIGYAVSHVVGTRPLSQDQGQSSLGRAWVGGDSSGNWDPTTMTGDVALVEMDALALPGLWLLRATGVAPCPADCADPPDGVVNVVDFLALIGDWGGSGPCDCADGGDGVVNVVDFLAMLGAWGSCPGPQRENEPNCGLPTDFVNGGCYPPAPEVFSPIACGQTYEGSGAYDGSVIDSDWYEIVVDEPTVFTWRVTAQFESLIGLAETIPPGAGDCADYTGLINPLAFGGVGETASVTTDCLPPGTYWFFVAPQFTEIVPCPTPYGATLTCERPCAIPVPSPIYGLDFRGGQIFQSTTNDFVGDYTIVSDVLYDSFAMDMDVSATTLYAVLFDGSNTYGTIDTGTGAFTAMGTLTGPAADSNVAGMSVHPITGSWYLSVFELDASILYVGDITTGVFTPVGDIGFFNIDLAIDGQGNAYGHDLTSDQLISIDLATGAGTAIGPTGYSANWAQGMDFNYADGILYATIYTGGGTGVFATFDLLTGQAIALQDTTPLNAEMEMVVASPHAGPGRTYTVKNQGATTPGGNRD